MEQAETPRGPRSLSAVLEHGAESLGADPAMAEREAAGILEARPGLQQALALLVSARRAQGDTAGARAMLETMATAYPKLATVHHELGLLLADLGESHEAVAALSRVVELEPNHTSAWRVLGDQLAETGETARAAEAYRLHFGSSINDLKLLESTAAFSDDQLPVAEGILRAFLEIYPTDVFAVRRLSDVCARLSRTGEAAELASRAENLSRES